MTAKAQNKHQRTVPGSDALSDYLPKVKIDLRQEKFNLVAMKTGQARLTC
jgi:hypothetical protein